MLLASKNPRQILRAILVQTLGYAHFYGAH